MTEKDSRLSNKQILDDDLNGYLDTYNDLESARSPTTPLGKLFSTLDRARILPVAWANSVELSLSDRLLQLDPSLPDYQAPSDIFHDVYLVTVPHWGWPTSRKHWSFYSQGHFFHLVDKKHPRLAIESLGLDEVESELVAIRRDVDAYDFHNKNGTKEERKKRLPLVVYNVGQTQFNVEQIQKLAEYVIDQFDSYTLWEKNCHLFALSLMCRTAMRKRDGSIFVGTMAQIINWDLSLKNHNPNPPFSQYEGFLISDTSRGNCLRSSQIFSVSSKLIIT
jgi:hypothetical protein